MARKAQTDEKPKRATRESILAEFADFPGIKVIERRLNDPDGAENISIRLKDEPSHADDPEGKRRRWYLRWVNTDQQGRWHKVRNIVGYVAVRMDELQSADEIAGLAESKDGLVRMGDRGKVVLVKQPLKLYTLRKREEQDRRNRRSRNAKLVKEELANAAGSQLGSEAGDVVNDEFTVEMTRHRSTIGDELAERA